MPFVGRQRTTLNPKARKAASAFWPLFPLYARDNFPVVRHFFCRFPTEQVLYYRNLGLYYGLAPTTLPLYAKHCVKVKGVCLSCDFGLGSNLCLLEEAAGTCEVRELGATIAASKASSTTGGVTTAQACFTSPL